MRYRCPDCGWTGTEKEMLGDYISMEFWSVTICPGCETWWCLDDYEIVTENDGLTEQRINLLWAIITRAYRDAKRGNVGAAEFCYAIALRPTKLTHELMKALWTF